MKIMKNVKRILAFFLCICVVAAYWTAEPVQAASTLYTSDDEENKSYTLNGEKHTICYEDDFATEADYIDALGDYSTYTNKIVWSEGCLTPTTGNKNALFYGINDAESMQNYSISADVTVSNNTKFTALVARGTKNASTSSDAITGYEFGIVGSKIIDADEDGTAETYDYTFRLYQRGGRSTVLKGGNATYAVSKILEGFDTANDTVNMRFNIQTDSDGTVVMNCYAALNGGEEINVFGAAVTDSNTKKFTAGVPGFRTSDTGGSIDNVRIVSVKDDDTCLYADNFSYAEGYTKALTGSSVNGLSLKEDDNNYLQSSGTQTSLFCGITNSSTLENYTISADLTFTSLTTGNYSGLVVYASSDAKADYEFAIVGKNFRIYERGTNTLNTSKAISNYFEIPNDTQSKTIRLSLTVITSDSQAYFVCKANYDGVEKYIYENTITDTSTTRSAGVPGIKSNWGACKVDNVLVQTNTQYIESLSATYADVMTLGTAFAPYDIPKVDKMLAAYEGLDIMLDADTIATLDEISTVRESWNTTSDEAVAVSYKTIYDADKWDTGTAWNVYQRLSATQKALLSDTYDALVTTLRAETQASNNTISIGWVGDSIPTGLLDGLVDDTYTYSVDTFTEGTDYEIIVFAQAISEDELHSYMRMENTPLIVVTTNTGSEDDATVNLQFAEKYALPWIDINAYTNGGGTDVAEIYADAILSIEPLFATETSMGFAYDENELNSFLLPELFSATIKNESVPANQGLGFKTNISEYQKTGTAIASYGTIFARYSSTQSYDDMVLENVGNGKYFNANVSVTDDSEVYGSSYIAGVNLGTNTEFSRVYIARSYIKYADGSVYYSMNTREDLSSSLATRTGVVEGYACRALTGVARNMVIALAEKGIDVSSVGTYESDKLTFNANATSNDAQAIFELLCGNQSILDGIQNTVYLSSTGSDANIGTENSPYATFEKALKEVPNGGIIWVEDTVTVPADFEWEERDYQITVSGGGTLNFALEDDTDGNAVYRMLVLGDDVTFDAVGLTFREGESQAETDIVYANGHKLVVEDDVTMTGTINLYGGGNRTDVESTDVKLMTGNYRRVFGGSYAGKVNGDTNLYIGGTVNANADVASHSHGYDIYGGGDAYRNTNVEAYNVTSGTTSTVAGCANITFTDEAKANYLLGGCRGTGSVGTTEVSFEGGQVMSLFGGNDTSTSINGTYVKVTGGIIEQLFGANQNSTSGVTMTEGVTIDLLGGKIARRVYGGCYNDYSDTGWETNICYVIGNINLNISSDVDMSLDAKDPDTYGLLKYDDLSIYACSRYNPAFDEEVCTITFLDEAAYNMYYAKLGANDITMQTIMSGVTAADTITTNEQ